MPDANLTDIVLILDHSDNIAVTEGDIISEINALITSQKAAGGLKNAVVTLIKYDDLFEYVWYRIPLADVPTLTSDEFADRGRMAVKDGIGRGIIDVFDKYERMSDAVVPVNILFCIMSYGIDEISLTFHKNDALKERLDWQEAQFSWDFWYWGTNQTADVEAAKYGIDLAQSFDFVDDAAGVQGAINGGADSFDTSITTARTP